MEPKTKQAILITWAGLATVAAMIFALLALCLFVLRTREMARNQNRTIIHSNAQASAPPPALRPSSSPASPGFANVKEADVPGRYKFSVGGEELGTMTLNADHTFINKDGTTFKQYNWQISEDGLWIQWQRFRTRFSILEKPGTYVAPAPNGEDQRLEKIE